MGGGTTWEGWVREKDKRVIYSFRSLMKFPQEIFTGIKKNKIF